LKGFDETFPQATELAEPALPVMLIAQLPDAPPPVFVGALFAVSKAACALLLTVVMLEFKVDTLPVISPLNVDSVLFVLLVIEPFIVATFADMRELITEFAEAALAVISPLNVDSVLFVLLVIEPFIVDTLPVISPLNVDSVLFVLLVIEPFIVDTFAEILAFVTEFAPSAVSVI
jgi:hypothetical protein